MSKYTDDLREALDLHNDIEIARRYDCPVIAFHTGHAHAFGRWDHRAEIYLWPQGETRYRTKALRAHAGSRLAESRAANFELAKSWVADHHGYRDEWVPTGLPNSWMPKDAKERMVAELKAWRKEQRAKKASQQ